MSNIPDNLKCPECKVPLEYFEGGAETIGSHKVSWDSYQCPECKEIYSNQPDWDFMPGGKDYE